MKIASTIADFRNYTNSPAECVRAYEGTGFKHLDYSFYVFNFEGSEFMSDNWVKNVSDAAKEAEKLGFDFVQAHSPGNDYFNEDKEIVIKGNIRAIEACGYLGIKNLVVHSGRSNSLFFPNDKQKYLDSVREFYESLFPYMEKYGVNVLAENYIPGIKDVCSFYSGEDLNEIIDLCNHPNMGICWDIGHANLTAPDQYADIVKMGERLKAVHIQDNMGHQDDHLCPYMGTVDIDGVMRGLKDNGFIDRGGYFTFECDNIVTFANSWPNYRYNSGENISQDPDFNIKKQAVTLMYEIGKSILTRHNCFEE